ncbi:hypothetical protein FI667_g9058, partial [Globisporangium splendens]
MWRGNGETGSLQHVEAGKAVPSSINQYHQRIALQKHAVRAVQACFHCCSLECKKSPSSSNVIAVADVGNGNSVAVESLASNDNIAVDIVALEAEFRAKQHAIACLSLLSSESSLQNVYLGTINSSWRHLSIAVPLSPHRSPESAVSASSKQATASAIMKCHSIAVAAFIAAVATLAQVDAQDTPTPTPSLGPAPGTLGASEVAGIPLPGTPAASSSSSSSQKPGSNGTSTTAGSFNQDTLVNGSSSLPGLDDASSGGNDGSNATTSKLTGSTGTPKTVSPTPTPSPTSAASYARFAVGAISTAAVVTVTLFV